jgi:hypothetical protein
MGVYEGLGPMTNVVLWLEVVVLAVFVGLRLYTQISLLDAVGADAFSFVYFLYLTGYPVQKGIYIGTLAGPLVQIAWKGFGCKYRVQG